MINKVEEFNTNNYTTLKAAMHANRVWYKSLKEYYKGLYKSQLKQEGLTLEQQSHIFDHYQQNLSHAHTSYKQNIKNIDFKK